MFHESCWTFKYLLILMGYASSFYLLPISLLENYFSLAEYGSFLVLVFLGVFYLLGAFKVNDTLVNAYEQDRLPIASSLIVALTLLVTLANFLWLFFTYLRFGTCSSTLILVNCLFFLLFYMLVLFRTRSDASLLTSSLVVLFLLYQ